MNKSKVSKKYGKSLRWLHTDSGVEKLEHVKEVFGSVTEETFDEYFRMQADLLRILEDGYNDRIILKKEIGLFLYKDCKHPNITGYTFYERLIHCVYDDNKFLNTATIRKLIKIKELINKRREAMGVCQDITKYFDKSNAWIFTPTGLNRQKQVKEIFGSFSFDNFKKYYDFPSDVGILLENAINSKELSYIKLAEVVSFNTKNREVVARHFVNRICHTIQDDNHFPSIDTIYRLIKVKEHITGEKIILSEK